MSWQLTDTLAHAQTALAGLGVACSLRRCRAAAGGPGLQHSQPADGPAAAAVRLLDAPAAHLGRPIQVGAAWHAWGMHGRCCLACLGARPAFLACHPHVTSLSQLLSSTRHPFPMHMSYPRHAYHPCMCHPPVRAQVGHSARCCPGAAATLHRGNATQAPLGGAPHGLAAGVWRAWEGNLCGRWFLGTTIPQCEALVA